jgi:hypothetical protein
MEVLLLVIERSGPSLMGSRPFGERRDKPLNLLGMSLTKFDTGKDGARRGRQDGLDRLFDLDGEAFPEPSALEEIMASRGTTIAFPF